MALTKPTSRIRWGAAGSSPSGGEKSAGFTPGDRPPQQWYNWILTTIDTWMQWADERFFDGGTPASFVLRAPVAENGTADALGGDAPSGSDTNGGSLILSSGSSRGTGYGQVLIQAATTGSAGTTERVPETYITVGGSAGQITANKYPGNATTYTLLISARYAANAGGGNAQLTMAAADDGARVVIPASNTPIFPLSFPYAGVIQAIRAYVATDSGTTSVTMKLYKKAYTDNPNTAGTAITTITNASTDATWAAQLSASSLAETISANNYYWIAFSSVGAQIGVRAFEIDITSTDIFSHRIT